VPDVRVALCQVRTELSAPLDDRVRLVADLVRDQAACDLVVLPELWPSGAFDLDEMQRCAQPMDGSVVTAMRQAARDAGVWLHAGSFVERAADDRLFNTSVLVDDAGAVRATYRKLHLFGFRGGEAGVLSGGDDVVVCETPFGVLGLATCYDLRFPELFRALVDAGATCVLLPSAWPQRRVAHWTVLTRARAIEDQVVVVAPNAAGTQASVPMAGRSVVVDAWGDLLAETGADDAEVLHVDVDLDAVTQVRESFPVLRDRRL
jgi:predicted amidohydrolase